MAFFVFIETIRGGEYEDERIFKGKRKILGR